MLFAFPNKNPVLLSCHHKQPTQSMSFALSASKNPYKTIIQRGLLFATLTVAILLVFQPFGTYESDISYKYLKLCGYGLVTLCAMVVAGLIELAWSHKHSFKRLERYLIPTLYLLITGFFNHGYFAVTVLGTWHWYNQILFFFYVATIGAFPVAFMLLVGRHARQIRLSQTNSTESGESVSEEQSPQAAVDQPSQLVILSGENKNEVLNLNINELVSIKAADNYCEVTAVRQQTVTTNLLRISLNKLLEQFPTDIHIERCHRSYAVHIDAVTSYSGNASGLTLMTSIDGFTIPVSRAYVKAIKNALDSTS